MGKREERMEAFRVVERMLELVMIEYALQTDLVI